MEAPEALKFSSRNNSLNQTEHLSAGFYTQEDDDLDAWALEAVFETESVPHIILI